MAAPRKDCGPMDEMSILKPLEHSVLEVSIEGGDISIDGVAMPYPLEHSGVSRAADLVSEMSVPEPLEHSVLDVPLEVGDGSVGSMTVSDPLEHSGVSVHAEPLSTCLPRLHSEESRNRGSSGPAGVCRGHCRRACWLGGTMFSDRLGRRDGIGMYD